MKIDWNFPSNDYGQRNGISDSGVETFKGRPIKSLAREICQNSLDAGLANKTVKIIFEDFEYDSSKFPAKSSLMDALSRSKETWKNEKIKKTTNFLNQAISVLDSEKIRFLRVSDFNTTGLQGSNHFRDTDWTNLVKASGSSDKNENAGGSFGIGKFAPFVCSDLRTVFYSTIDIKGLQATQGVSRLVSFKKSDNSDLETQGVGYYGETDKNMPLMECFSFQESYKRSSSGTDIFIAGFKNFEKWEIDLINEILDGFLYAIFVGTLEVEINSILISKNTLESIISTYKEDISYRTKKYHEVLTSDKTKWIHTDFKDMGMIKLGLLLLHDDAPRRIAMIRKPWMKILDQGRINGSIPFVGVLIFEGEDINRFLRKIENPQHNAWEPKRLEDNLKITTAKNFLKSIRKFIINELNDMIVKDGIEELDLPGAGDILPMDDLSDNDSSKLKDQLSPKISRISLKKVKNIKTSTKKSETISELEYEEMISGGIIEDGDDTYLRSNGIGKRVHGENSYGETAGFDGEIDDLSVQRVTVKPMDLRLICREKNKGKYQLVFSSFISANECKISFYKLDEQGTKAPIIINKAFQKGIELSINDNTINDVVIVKGVYTNINLTIDTYDYFTAEVKINGVER